MLVDENMTSCGGYHKCNPNFTNVLVSLCLLCDDMDMLLEYIMCCQVLGDAIDNKDVDEVQECVVGKATLEVTQHY